VSAVVKTADRIGHILSPWGWAQFKFKAPVSDSIFGRSSSAYDVGEYGHTIMPTSATGFKPAPAFDEIPEFICMTVTPTIRLPQHRSMDIGPHSKALSTAVTTICVAYYSGKAHRQRKCIELQLGERRYVVCLWPDSFAAAPLAQMSHRLYILCRQPKCDLSPVFALADPLEYPHYAAIVARAVYSLAPSAKDVKVARWLPICDYIDCGQRDEEGGAENSHAVENSNTEDDQINIIFKARGYEQSFGKAALDILSNPQKLQLLFKLFFDRSKETRKAGFAAGLWTLDPDAAPGDVWPQIEDAVKRRDAYQLIDLVKLLLSGEPEKGQFTVAASAAAAYVIHMTHAPILLGQGVFRFTL
jgi:hypothetical protein